MIDQSRAITYGGAVWCLITSEGDAAIVDTTSIHLAPPAPDTTDTFGFLDAIESWSPVTWARLDVQVNLLSTPSDTLFDDQWEFSDIDRGDLGQVLNSARLNMRLGVDE